MPSEVRGVPELTSGIQHFSKDLEKTIPQQALRIMLQAAQDRAPVRTGALRASGYIEGNVIGFGVPYAFPVHWGTRKMPKRPFLKQGIEATQDAWVKVYEDDIQKQLDQIRGA